jgi:protein-S-isoprenylcysteine O-methyltransferase Ste14
MTALKRINNVIDGLIYLLIGPFTVVGTVPFLLMQADTAMGLPRFTTAQISTTGFLLMDLGGVLALWCSWLMRHGGGTPIPSAPASRLVTTGPYAYVRHPMMYALFIVGCGEVLISGSLLVLLWIPVATRAGVLFIASYEEPVLLARFKDEYAAYCETVPRWIPNLGRG